ncbi:EAL domain-containing protein [Sulfitobacter sp. M220]|nr:EAL domain-containing protein [Sulfitobacter sp. M22]MCF7776455.1 EAL domain-containing protein [Sulfitobacter sp. M220]
MPKPLICQSGAALKQDDINEFAKSFLHKGKRVFAPAGFTIGIALALAFLWFGWQGFAFVGAVLLPLIYLFLGRSRAVAQSTYASRQDAVRPVAAPVINSISRSRPARHQHDPVLFQPQISTHSGEVSGFCAIRASCVESIIPHQQNGTSMGAPSETDSEPLFPLSTILLEAKKLPRTCRSSVQIIYNLAPSQMDDPLLLQKVEWELERLDLPPRFLRIALPSYLCQRQPGPPVIMLLRKLHELGSQTGLNGFGSGPRCVEIVQKYDINVVAIDPSLTTGANLSINRRLILSTVLAMAQDLGTETLACGVQTSGEHELLSQLGCDNVQGPGIAQPMPPEQVVGWMHTHIKKLDYLPRAFGDIA